MRDVIKFTIPTSLCVIMTIATLTRYSQDFKIVLVAFGYYLAAAGGYLLVFQGSHVMPTWPPSGVAFAMLILLGRNTWPGITIGALIVNVMAYWHAPDIPTESIVMISTGIAMSNTIEAVVGNFLITNWIKDTFPFSHTSKAFGFLFVAVLMSFISSGIATVSLWSNDAVGSDAYLKTWLSIWVGNAVGILLFTPFILSIFKRYKFDVTAEKFVEIGIFITGVLTLAFMLQIEGMSAALVRSLPFLAIPFLLWLAFRFPLVVSTTAVVIISIVAIYATTLNEGPFVLHVEGSSTILLQIFIGVVSISTIILASTVKERADAKEHLQQFNENLEEMVKARTKELKGQIDTRKKAEEKLQNTNEELHKRNKELDNFVYSVSHDLRAPIASVLGLINLAKKEDDLIMKDMYFDMINSSAIQQDNFIREILDQSRNSRLDIKREQISFKKMIDDTFEQLKHATDGGNAIKKVISVRQNKPFYSDSWRIKVILNNLVSNAIRYRHGKSPRINVDVIISNGKAQIIIEDNGRGIEKEHLPKVCDMFYRATDDNAGSGLGLYIVKETVDKLNGKIDIFSEYAIGTKVVFEIPEIDDDSPVEPSIEPKSKNQIKINHAPI